jgi:hypothetical protein
MITVRLTVTHEISTPAEISESTIQPSLRRALGLAGLELFIKLGLR